MNGSNSSVDAIGPAVEHARRILFRPFDPGRWLVLGFLTFLVVLPTYLSGPGWNLNLDRGHLGWQDGSGDLDRALGWMARHTGILALIAFFVVLVLLVLFVAFLWLSSRAVFCYLDSVARGRAEVVRPWRENRELADSFFFWRLMLSLAVLVLLALFLVPVLFSVWKLLRSGEEASIWSLLFGTGLVLVFMPILTVQIAAAVVRTMLIDFVAPIQYARRIPCSAALRILGGLVRAHPLEFIVYVLLRIVLAVLIGVALLLLGCLTCCIGFCIAAIPIIGQAMLQPVHVFTRSFPLFFLRGYGQDFDVFAPGALGAPVRAAQAAGTQDPGAVGGAPPPPSAPSPAAGDPGEPPTGDPPPAIG